MLRKLAWPISITALAGAVAYYVSADLVSGLGGALIALWTWTLIGSPPVRDVKLTHRIPTTVGEKISRQYQSSIGASEDQSEESTDIEALALPQVNPATGLPMLNGVVDIHLNPFGIAPFEVPDFSPRPWDE